MADIHRARQLRQQETWAEKLVWRWLRHRRFAQHKFRRQHPLGDYYLDFFCEEARLNIELDGGQHGFPGQRQHDMQREQFLQARGIKTLRFWNSHLRRSAQTIRDTIFNELQARAPHPLPEYAKPMVETKKSQLEGSTSPRPSPPGEGELSAAARKTCGCVGRTTRRQSTADDGRSLSHPMGEGQGEGQRQP